MIGLAFLMSGLLFTLSAIHFYWAFGGLWGFDVALPKNEHGQRVLNPKKFDSIIMALGLALFGLYFLIKTGWISASLPSIIASFLKWAIPIIFIARSIGDFKYIGFFKKVKSSSFARYDSKLFSPLCLFLGLLAIGIEILS